MTHKPVAAQGHRKRLRDRFFQNGIESFHDYEVLGGCAGGTGFGPIRCKGAGARQYLRLEIAPCRWPPFSVRASIWKGLSQFQFHCKGFPDP